MHSVGGPYSVVQTTSPLPVRIYAGSRSLGRLMLVDSKLKGKR